MTGLGIAFFGSSLVSAYWNGAATYYRGLLRALAARGHRITFCEPDAFDRQRHRDIADPPWARVVVFPPDADSALRCLETAARTADVLVKASGVGVLDAVLEAGVLAVRRPGQLAVFWDVDAPATLDHMRRDPTDALAPQVPRFDLVLTYGGGEAVVAAYRAFGARACVPVYNALDPETHHPVPPDPRLGCDLLFVGNRLPDRETRVEAFFLEPAARRPGYGFLLGGSGWADKPLPPNVRALGHVYTADHNVLNASARAVLNITRDSMARTGFSPPTRIFEAGDAGACLVTDAWDGIAQFLEPDREILVARDGAEVAAHLDRLDAPTAQRIGRAARRRLLAHHTYAHRAAQVEEVLTGHRAARPRRSGTGLGSEEPRCPSLRIVVLGLSITSSWGNGHATTYRALLRALAARGHDVLFLERDQPWYAANRDLPVPPFGRAALYHSREELADRFTDAVRQADLVMVGSYVPEGIAVGRWVQATARGVTAFYDIDTPVTLAALARNDCAYLAPELIPGYGLYLSFTGGPVLGVLRTRYGAGRPRALYCSVDPEQYHPEPCAPEWDLGYLGTYSPDRQPRLDALLLEPARRRPERGFVVAGPQYPDDLTWPANVARIAHLPPAGHRAFYTRQRFTLNVTRADMVACGWSPSVRLFEAAACGTPILSDRWPGLDEIFVPGREILPVDGPAEVLACLEGLPETERRALGARARARVLARHTAHHRAGELERHYLDAATRKPP